MDSVFLVIPVLLVLMFSLGLELRLDSFYRVLACPKAITIGLCGQLLLLPLIAFAVAASFNMSTEYKIGLVLIACCPGGVSSNVFAMLVKGNVALSVVLTSLSSFISILSVPIILGIAASLFSDVDQQVEMPFGMIVAQSVVMVFVPIILGMLLRRLKPGFAVVLLAALKRAAMPLLVLVVTAFAIEKYDDIRQNMYGLALAVSFLLAATMFLGYLLARLFMLKPDDSRSIIIEIGLQNAALAITIASSPVMLNNKNIAIPAVIYALIMNIAVIGFVFGVKKRSCKV